MLFDLKVAAVIATKWII